MLLDGRQQDLPGLSPAPPALRRYQLLLPICPSPAPRLQTPPTTRMKSAGSQSARVLWPAEPAGQSPQLPPRKDTQQRLRHPQDLQPLSTQDHGSALPGPS